MFLNWLLIGEYKKGRRRHKKGVDVQFTSVTLVRIHPNYLTLRLYRKKNQGVFSVRLVSIKFIVFKNIQNYVINAIVE